jgi:hypothetical protein
MTAPKRRWFRFSISTLLILTAILAWAMAARPDIRTRTYTANLLMPREYRWTIAVNIGSVIGPKDNTLFHYVEFYIPQTTLWPFLALGAFVAWKGSRRIIGRRKMQPPEPSTH